MGEKSKPCPTAPPVDEKAAAVLRSLVGPGLRHDEATQLGAQIKHAMSDQGHFELLDELNDKYRPAKPTESRSLQGRSEAKRGAPGRDTSIFNGAYGTQDVSAKSGAER